MTNQYSKKSVFFNLFNSVLVKLPTPSNLSTLWNFGSLLSLCLITQIVSGILLATAYTVSMQGSYELVFKLMEMSESGWLTRYIHANGGSLFFFCLYMHVGRGIYYNSFTASSVWNIGVTIFLMTMAAAFLGYVLPLNQMSYWGASVITNLFSEVPMIGPDLVKLIWGSNSVSEPTITRFFTFHFLIPFMILALVMVHITLLHQSGSSNPLGLKIYMDKIPFHSYLSYKDMMGALIMFFVFMLFCLYAPLMLGDDENFTQANPSVTPNHIQPEWYFLFAYAILRSIPNKLGGVVALVLSVLILYTLPFMFKAKMKSNQFYPLSKLSFYSFSVVVLLLTWNGACPVEDPYIVTGQTMTFLYFLYYLINPYLYVMWDKLNKM
uniref:Cytochrome b n=1 Tax=Onisimus nanseni TaxID=583350 RepID=D3G9L0_ONINA|nr:cytochrome b [Onisimus nanseni]